MTQKEFKQKIALALQAQDVETAFDGLYYGAMSFGKLDLDWLNGATPAQVRRLAETIQRLEDRDLLPEPDDEEMVQVRQLIANYFAASDEEPEPDVLEEPEGRYRASEPDILDCLTPAQLAQLDESIRQIDRGEFYTHEEVQQKVREWLLK